MIGARAAILLAALAAPPVHPADDAIAALTAGDYARAARAAATALRATPEDATLRDLAGAVLLGCGAERGANEAFGTALSLDPGDSLALYGRALCRLSRGERAAAVADLDRAARAGGDASSVSAARQYIGWLSGGQLASSAGDEAPRLTALTAAMRGMQELRASHTQVASADLKRALSALPADPLAVVPGLFCTFEAAAPIAAVAPGTVACADLSPPLPAMRAVTGAVVLSPGNLPASAAYVGYEVDGASLSLVNVPPYEGVWDSKRAANGWHRVDVVVYDHAGRQITRASRRIRIFNPESSAEGGAGSDRLQALRRAVWRALTLRPDPAACAYRLGAILQSQGDIAGARVWLLRACAVRPNYSAARAALAAAGCLQPPQSDAVWGGLPTEKVVALTFDDGPKPGMTEPLIDILQREHVPATFFVIGRHVAEYPALVRRIAASGMEIANHTYTHRNLVRLSPSEAAREAFATQAAVLSAAGVLPKYMRPPGGDWNEAVAQAMRSCGLSPCFWTVDAFNAETVSAQEVAAVVCRRARPGSIILMHNGKASTIEALPAVIHTLRARGLQFVTVDALANALARAAPSERTAATLAAMQNARQPE